MSQISIFVSYSHKDHIWLNEGQYDLIPFLIRSLKIHDIEFWHDHALKKMPGVKYKDMIKSRIDAANYALLLISQDFINSEFIRQYELPWIRKRVEQNHLSVIPILVRPIVLRKGNPIDWISERQILPGKPTPLIDYSDDLVKWEHVRTEILDAIMTLILTPPQPKPSPKGDIVPDSEAAAQDPPSFPKKPILEEKPETGKSTRKISRKVLSFSIAAAAIAVMMIAFFMIKPGRRDGSVAEQAGYDEVYIQNLEAFLGAIPWMNWILYTPTEHNPYKNQEASEASIRKDLQVLRKHAFDGLITMTAIGTAQHIPRIAHEEGFNMVIMSVWDLRDEEEIANAIRSAEWANAYCLGHRGLNKLFNIGELEQLMERMRKETKRPVSTSEVILEYETNPKLAALGDFLFPDVHTLWHQGMRPENVWKETIELAIRAAQVVSNTDKLVLLKMVSYPSGGAEGLTVESQKNFFRMVIEESLNRIDIPARVSFSFLCAFDPLWKVNEYGWAESEKYTGLFTQDREPKPAVTELDWQKTR